MNRDMRVAEKMTSNPTVVNLHDSLAAARAIMLAEGFKHLPVVDDGKLVGVITDRDIKAHSHGLRATRVANVMRTELSTLTPQATIEDAARLMLAKKIGCLPVVQDGKLIGILTRTDLLKALLDLRCGSAHYA